jgi:hypothetical protein
MLLASAPTVVFAQSGVITGTVTDSSGGVLPGVTVEATSPVLIEGTRTVTTDGAGLYRVIDLRPGTYAVTFTLPGFRTLRREGLELSASFTATVNAVLQVGALQEDVTVSATPLVDLQNVIRQEVISKAVMDTIPIAKSLASFTAIVPGLQVSASNRDVGGTQGDRPLGVAIYGGRANDQHVFYDSFRTNNINAGGSTGGGGSSSVYYNPAAIQEIVMEVASHSVRAETSGAHVNVIPKQGGNTFSGVMILNGTKEGMQSDNLSDALRAQGLTTTVKNKAIFDLNAGLGGPIARDKVWFYGAYRRWGAEVYQPNVFFNQTPLSWAYTPDFDRPAYDQNLSTSKNGRITWQMNQDQRVTFALENQDRCLCYQGITAGTNSPEATAFTFDESSYWQTKWTNTVTNRLLLNAGVSGNYMNWDTYPQPGVPPNAISVLESSTGRRNRNTAQYTSRIEGEGINAETYNLLFDADYLVGAHSLRFGGNWMIARPQNYTTVEGDRTYRALNGEPVEVILRATPLINSDELTDVAFWVQDQWRREQLTLTLGLRYAGLFGGTPDQDIPAGTFVPARHFDRITDVVGWHDLLPRIGASYDLFGNGRTAVKASLNKFVLGAATNATSAKNPQQTVVTTVTRSWNDVNGNFEPDCDLRALDGNGECGPISNRLFGQTTIPTRVRDDETLHGWGMRDGVNWEFSTGVQHELMPNVSVGALYVRRAFSRFLAIDNLLVGPSDFDPFCITGPRHPDLPAGGGQEVCGLYDVRPTLFGRVSEVQVLGNRFGKQSEVYNGLDLTVNLRLPATTVQGGVNVGRAATNDCEIRPDSPQRRFCEVTPPFLPDVKLALSHQLPWWGLELSGTIQSSPGEQILATYAAPSALAESTLGRPLASGRTVSVELVEPGTMFIDRVNQVDFRLGKVLNAAGVRVRGTVDVYNLLNASTALSVNNTYGPQWQRPVVVLPGRFVKVGVQLDF